MRIDIDSCEEILITITRNKTRSLLTAFGVFWGIFMLVALIGGGQGMQQAMSSQFEALPRIRLSWFRRRRERRIKVSGKDVGGIWNSLILSVCAMGWRKLISLLLLSPIGEERQCMEIRNMNVA